MRNERPRSADGNGVALEISLKISLKNRELAEISRLTVSQDHRLSMMSGLKLSVFQGNNIIVPINRGSINIGVLNNNQNPN